MQLKRPLARITRDCTGWLLIAALFYAPWDFGGTTGSAIQNLNWILGAMLALWLVSLVVRRAGVRVPGYNVSWLLLLISGVLLLIGWWMALNAHAISDVDHSVFLPLRSPFLHLPGSVDYSLSSAWMLRATLLLTSIWFVADLVQDGRWLLGIWWAIGLAGGSIAILGLLQKATGAEMVFWQTRELGIPPVPTFFATYYYHANAGAYLNLTLPLVLGLAYRYTTRPSNPLHRALWLTMSVIMLVAVASNTSRMAQMIAVLIVVALFVVSARRILHRVKHMELATAVIALVVIAAAFWAIVQASHLDESIGRWGNFQRAWSHDARWLVARTATRALPTAGALGFGPGTFSVVFPYFNAQSPTPAEGIWLFLHNDYLQTLMEWGWFGGLLWMSLFAGGALVALRALANRRRTANWLPRQRMLLPLILIALGGVAIHALVDFPLQISSIQLYVATYLGICWGSASWKKLKC